MKYYDSYMGRQELSDTVHARLMALGNKAPVKKSNPWKRWGAIAACAALLLGMGAFSLGQAGDAPAVPPVQGSPERVPHSTPPGTVNDPIATEPVLDNAGQGDRAGFVAEGPGEEAKFMLPMVVGVDFADVTDGPEVAASIALPEGAFSVPLTKEDIQKLFWGPEGKPEVEHFKTDPGDFPVMLMNWAGYTVTGQATYDGSGDLWELYVQGRKGEDSFALRAAPGRIPPTCLVEKGAVTTDVHGIEVSGWYRSYDNDGDDVIEHICTSEFLANGVGFRFTNTGSGGLRSGEDEATDLGGAQIFNAMVVTQLCYEDGFWLDQFAHTDDIPGWASENYDTPAQAVTGAEDFALDHPEADFLSYLPTEGPEDYGEFHGRLNYQEGVRKTFFVRWTRGYDDVEVEARLPEGDKEDYAYGDLVDVTVPESYDWRLYEGSISDSVPEEYRDSFYKPAFRAEDMSLEIVKARMNDKDTGGQSCRFYVIHENGAVVGYNCSGVSAEYVWGLVEATLEK